ncbi:formin-like protein 18 [Oryza sativa Japonica Group]|uniref:formin-like protein 18 n=1 Tax=Oryza sativa subsp. japonica TaxID=39947 RepID=UPI00339D17E1
MSTAQPRPHGTTTSLGVHEGGRRTAASRRRPSEGDYGGGYGRDAWGRAVDVPVVPVVLVELELPAPLQQVGQQGRHEAAAAARARGIVGCSKQGGARGVPGEKVREHIGSGGVEREVLAVGEAEVERGGVGARRVPASAGSVVAGSPPPPPSPPPPRLASTAPSHRLPPHPPTLTASSLAARLLHRRRLASLEQRELPLPPPPRLASSVAPCHRSPPHPLPLASSAAAASPRLSSASSRRRSPPPPPPPPHPPPLIASSPAAAARRPPAAVRVR